MDRKDKNTYLRYRTCIFAFNRDDYGKNAGSIVNKYQNELKLTDKEVSDIIKNNGDVIIYTMGDLLTAICWASDTFVISVSATSNKWLITFATEVESNYIEIMNK